MAGRTLTGIYWRYTLVLAIGIATRIANIHTTLSLPRLLAKSSGRYPMVFYGVSPDNYLTTIIWCFVTVYLMAVS